MSEVSRQQAWALDGGVPDQRDWVPTFRPRQHPPRAGFLLFEFNEGTRGAPLLFPCPDDQPRLEIPPGHWGTWNRQIIPVEGSSRAEPDLSEGG
jgi:hypothetical protein